MGYRTEKHHKRKYTFFLPVLFLLIFIVWTFLCARVDVQKCIAAGVDAASGRMLETSMEEEIGLAGINLKFRDAVQFNPTLYRASKYLGYVCILVAACMALYALLDCIRHRGPREMKLSLLFLMGVYALFVLLYVLFEKIALNMRPFMLDGQAEASYPSTHTLLACMAVGSTAVFWLKERSHKLHLPAFVFCLVIALLTVFCRTLSGVHWLSDIAGGILLSLAPLSLYALLI